ncbi:MAG: Hpt domain-containing protein [Candidatus Omnitrophica bacterium]|nr:Hpt domain-containing protein [Candidatus Omnitrophota bacterium]
MSEKVLDFEDFMNRVQDDKDLFFELLDIFVEDFHKKRKELEEAVKTGDSKTVEHVAHFLKGSCGNISAKPLRDVFIKLEEKGVKGYLEGLEQDLEDVDREFEELVIHIGKLRAKP